MERYYRSIMGIVTFLRLGQSVLVICPDAEYKSRIEEDLRKHFPGKIPGKLTIEISSGQRLNGETFNVLTDEMPQLDIIKQEVDKLRLAILDRPLSDTEETAFTDEELGKILRDSDHNYRLAEVIAFETLIKDDKKLRVWSHAGDGFDSKRLKQDLGEIAKRYRTRAAEGN